VELGVGNHIVGRSPAAEFPLKVESVSGKHAVFEVAADGKVRFRDLGSTNGTFSGGVKVEEGEWFPGSELKLGQVRLRLLDQDDAAAPAPGGDAGDRELHRRAVEQALAGKRRGSPLLLVGLLLLIGGAGGAWWMFGRDDGAADPDGSTRGGAAAPGGTTGPADLLGGLGAFGGDELAAWSLGAGLGVAQGALVNDGPRRRATLSPRFAAPSDGGVAVSATVGGGLRAWPILAWGVGDEDQPRGDFAGAALGSAPVAVPLPDEAEWFQLALVLEGSGRLSALRAESAELAVATGTHEGHRHLGQAGNLRLFERDGSLWYGWTGTGVDWAPAAGGFDANGAEDAWLELTAGAATLASGPLQILAEGGPVTASAGVVVEDSPGLIVGGETHRVQVRFSAPRRVEGTANGVLLRGPGTLRMRWDLTAAYTERARVVREMRRAAASGDDLALLRSSAELLREWPLDEAEVGEALGLRRQTIVRGRAELGALQIEAAESLFLDSTVRMAAAETRARALAARLPGTDVAREAGGLENDLRTSRELAGAEGQLARSKYRERLRGAIAGTYPLMAAWLGGEGQTESGGGQ